MEEGTFDLGLGEYMDTAVVVTEQDVLEPLRESESQVLKQLGFKKARAIKKHPDKKGQKNTYYCGCAGTNDGYRYTEAVTSDGTIWVLAGTHQSLEEYGFRRAPD